MTALRLEPRYRVGFLARLLDLTPTTVRKLIEGGHFGAFQVAGERGDMSIPYSGLAQFFERYCASGQLIFEPHLRGSWVAEYCGLRAADLRGSLAGGKWGPHWLALPSGETRIPLSAIQHRLESITIEPTRRLRHG